MMKFKRIYLLILLIVGLFSLFIYQNRPPLSVTELKEYCSNKGMVYDTREVYPQHWINGCYDGADLKIDYTEMYIDMGGKPTDYGRPCKRYGTWYSYTECAEYMENDLES